MASAYEVKDFETQVIDASAQKPVIVDFWAGWCGPCVMLEPIITELAEENKDKWSFVKVNVDENEEIADRYNIRSIPAIRIFDNGEIIAHFNGLMYKKELNAWIEANLPNEGLTRLNIIKEMIEAGKVKESREELELLVKDFPGIQEAGVLLACEIVIGDPERAVALVSDIREDSPFFPYADSVRVMNELYNLHLQPERLPEGTAKNELLKAIDYIGKKGLDAAIEVLMDVVSHDKDYMNGIAFKACIAIFTMLGNEHPVTVEYRKRLDMALY